MASTQGPLVAGHGLVGGSGDRLQRRLVTTTDLPLKTIAPRAGFRSIAYMTTVFRRHFGTTPAALRAAAQGSP